MLSPLPFSLWLSGAPLWGLFCSFFHPAPLPLPPPSGFSWNVSSIHHQPTGGELPGSLLGAFPRWRSLSPASGPSARPPLFLHSLAMVIWIGDSPRVCGDLRGAGEADVPGETGMLGCRFFERYNRRGPQIHYVQPSHFTDEGAEAQGEERANLRSPGGDLNRVSGCSLPHFPGRPVEAEAVVCLQVRCPSCCGAKRRARQPRRCQMCSGCGRRR